MKFSRRNVLIGVAGIAGGALAGSALLRPRDHGAPYDAYFAGLNSELKANGPMRPCMVIDLDRLDHNLDLVTRRLAGARKGYRIVEKSLPCQSLIAYVARRSGTKRLMSFHQPFLNEDAEAFPDFDILMGKPLPVRSAALFYEKRKGSFDPSRQLQWLIDTPTRMEQYLALSKSVGSPMRVNVEIDVGLHRGGVADAEALTRILDIVAAHPAQLEFAGFMGYDGHVGFGVPKILGTPQELLNRVVATYRDYLDVTRERHPGLFTDRLTLNAGGSPNYALHTSETVSNEISVGTALLKPTHYDLETLTDHVPAAFIATPVLKASGPLDIPALEGVSRAIAWWNVNDRETYFIYGGYWLAEPEAPKGLKFNSVLGHSANQENLMGSTSTGLKVDDQVFFRPAIAEGVLLQFGDLITIRNGRICDAWPVYRQTA